LPETLEFFCACWVGLSRWHDVIRAPENFSLAFLRKFIFFQLLRKISQETEKIKKKDWNSPVMSSESKSRRHRHMESRVRTFSGTSTGTWRRDSVLIHAVKLACVFVVLHAANPHSFKGNKCEYVYMHSILYSNSLKWSSKK
jgi:hypothetical protein